MALRGILLLGEKVLRDPGVEVEAFDDELRALVADLLETMYFAEGIGLAAPQIGVSLRVCVLDLRDEDNPEAGRWVFVNPVIVESSDDEEKAPEGCLSIPEMEEVVTRPARVTVRGFDAEGTGHRGRGGRVVVACAPARDRPPGRGSFHRPAQSVQAARAPQEVEEKPTGGGEGVRILFWGTPEFAVPSLRALGEEGHDIVGVVTQPDRPAGRGRELRASAVKQEALDASFRILEPQSARSGDFFEEIDGLGADLSVVVAYGQILSLEVLNLPPMGSLNLHASLLPVLRGAAPINWSILQGDTVTGVTVMRMVEQMDAGPILFQTEEPIAPDETATDLRMRLSEIGGRGPGGGAHALGGGCHRGAGTGRVAGDLRA